MDMGVSIVRTVHTEAHVARPVKATHTAAPGTVHAHTHYATGGIVHGAQAQTQVAVLVEVVLVTAAAVMLIHTQGGIPRGVERIGRRSHHVVHAVRIVVHGHWFHVVVVHDLNPMVAVARRVHHHHCAGTDALVLHNFFGRHKGLGVADLAHEPTLIVRR
jgi:hypothetical protein